MTLLSRWWITLFLMFASSLATGLASAQTGITAVQLLASGHPESAIDVTWEATSAQDGQIDLDFDTELLAEAGTAGTLELAVRADQPAARITVRQRSVTYLNVGDEGPHWAVAGTEQRSGWRPVHALAPGRFRVWKDVPQPVPLRPAVFATAFADDARALALVNACTSPDEGACYTVTDPEFEITVTAGGRTTRKIVRVHTPNGC